MRNKTTLFANPIRSDLAIELIPSPKTTDQTYFKRTDIRLDARQAEKIGKKKGRYLTIDTEAFALGEADRYHHIEQAIAESLREFIVGKEIFVVGLGNVSLAADSLGSRTCAYVNVTRKMEEGTQVSALVPGVLGKTGIESYEVVKGVTNEIEPSTVLVIDSLCAGSSKRLLTSVQITDTGIVPGSGVGNHRMTLSQETLGCAVVCIGIPTVVYASTLVAEAYGNLPVEDMVVTPKDIELIMEDIAQTLGRAINRACKA